MSLEIRKSFAGRGLFATRKFRKGEFITEYLGPLLTAEEADRRGGRYLFRLTAKKYIDGWCTANVARYINHSCKPNAEAGGKKRLFIHAAKTILPGDEIFIDYGKEYLEQFIDPCKCPVCSPKR